VLVAAVVLLASSAGQPLPWSMLEDRFGPSDIALLAGNGRLTAGINDRGVITTCRWPSPGLQDHVDYVTRARNLPNLGVSPGSGMRWGIDHDGSVLWLSDPVWRVEARYADPGSPLARLSYIHSDGTVRVQQTAFVHPEKDLFVTRVEVQGTMPSRIHWHADLAPCTRLIPELPIQGLLEEMNDFAAFADQDRAVVMQFRPTQPSSGDRARAALLRKEEAGAEDWRAFRDGVWIGCASTESFSRVVAAGSTDDGSAWQQVGEGRLDERRAAVGDCDYVVTMKPQAVRDGVAATVFLAFGQNAEEVDAILGLAKATGHEALLSQLQSSWQSELGRSNLSETAENVRMQSQRMLLTLLQCQDAKTGAVVRAPTSQPPLALAFPQHGAWITAALDLAGIHDRAEAHTLFYADHVRRETLTGMPAGSLPAALYGNGLEAAPGFVLDLDASAWTLWSFHAHARFLADAQKRIYIERVWEAAEGLGNFLARWRNARTGVPLPSFEAETLRDGHSHQSLLSVYLGVHSARRIADMLGNEKPEWLRRERELADLIRYHCLDRAGDWRLIEFLPYLPRDLPVLETVNWDNVAVRRLAQLEDLHGLEAARTLSGIAVIWQGQPDLLRRLAPHLDGALLRASSPDGLEPSEEGAGLFFPDAATAAHCYIAGALYSGATL
jgi:hypothetical protein